MIRLALLSLVCLASSAVGSAARAQTGEVLDDALQAFARERGVNIVYSGDLVADRTTSCPRSTRASRQAVSVVLACLLDGTGLEARRLPSGTFALYRAAARPTPAADPARRSPRALSDARAVTVSGTVTDAATGETLIGATVYAPDLGRGVTTNAYGFYSLTLPTGPTRLVASYVGLATDDETISLRGDLQRDVALATDSTGLGEVVVEALDADLASAGPYASVAFTGDDVQALPALLGEADVLKALQLQPGVGGGVEGTSGLHVRGGTPDQTLILLDGIPVYNASHLFGFLSVFNADAVKRVELFKGGFPARYGGRLSSVVDVRMREGNREERQGHARIGLLSSQALVEGPIADGQGSYLVAGRRTYADLLAAPIFAATGGLENLTPTAYFYDLNAKANVRVGDRDRIYLSLYAGRDRFAATADEEQGDVGDTEGFLTWGNLTGALRWTRPLSDRLFAATTVMASDYQFRVGLDNRQLVPDAPPRQFRSRYRSSIRDVSVQTDLDWSPSARHTVRAGASATRHQYAPGAFTYNPLDADADTTLGAIGTGSWEGALYVEDEVRLGSALVSAGLRATGLVVEGATYGSLEPRLGARINVGAVAVRGSLARMTQYLHLLTTVGGLGLPADLWVPATERVGPERSWQASVGLARETGRTRGSVDAYAKQMDGLVAYREDAAFVRADADWQDQVTSGGGRSLGVELAVSHAGPRTSAQLGYTLARTDRRFDGLNGGARFPYRYDRTHDFELAARHRLSRRVDLSAAFLYQSGQAVTLPATTFFQPQPGPDLRSEGLGSFGGSSGQTYAYSPRNGYRLPPALRLDLGLDLYFRRGPRPRALSFEIYNVTNRANPQYVEINGRLDPETGEVTPFLVGKGLLPILPSVSYQFSF